MSETIKNKKTKALIKAPDFTIDPNIPSYENHPFFIKKAKEAKELLDRVGLPKELTKKK
jgi:hypothetical protein